MRNENEKLLWIFAIFKKLKLPISVLKPQVYVIVIHRIWETVYCFIKFRASQQKFLKTEIALITIKSIFSNSIYLFLFRILKIESEFFKHVDLSQASLKLGLEMDVVDLLFRFWILKRRSQANRPLFIPRMTDDTEAGLTVSLSLLFKMI